MNELNKILNKRARLQMIRELILLEREKLDLAVNRGEDRGTAWKRFVTNLGLLQKKAKSIISHYE
ncbi:MAG: hypothetical protein ACOCXQ_00660 [Patescibacteria group bacterium]